MTDTERLPTDVAEARLNHLIDQARRGALLSEEADRCTTELHDLVRRLEDTEDERDAAQDRLASIDRTTLPNLHHRIESDAKTIHRWRGRAESAELRASTAEARATELEEEQKKQAEITALVDASTEEQLNSCTEVVQYFRALAERTQAWGEQESARANRYRARVDAVKAECHAIVTEVHGQHDEDDDGMREAVRRIRSAVQSVSHDTPGSDDPRVTELEAEVARLATGRDALLKVAADLITSIGYARHTLATEILGWAEPGEDYSLDQIVVHAVAEYRADQSTIRRLTA